MPRGRPRDDDARSGRLERAAARGRLARAGAGRALKSARFLGWALLLASAQADAAWLGACPRSAAAPDDRILEATLGSDGRESVLVAADRPIAGCPMVEIAGRKEAIRWSRVVSREDAARLSKGAILTVGRTGTLPPVSDVSALEEPPRTAPPAGVREKPAAPPATKRLAEPRRALWAWEPAAWSRDADALLRLAGRHEAGLVFITVPLDAGGSRVADPKGLAAFIARAATQGVQVWAVAGDPRAVLASERAAYVARARAYAAYNREAEPRSRLAGLQLDIEPYLLPGYRANVEGWLTAYVDTVASVREAAAMPVDVAIPFWWAGQMLRGAPLLDRLAPHVASVTVMNYSTSRERLRESAQPFLEWGTRARREVRIALEAGPLPDETQLVYRPARAGQLWIVPVQERSLIVVLDEPRENPHGASLTFSHSVPLPASRLTFHRDLEALNRMVRSLEAEWRAWPSFSGIALHGLE